MAISKRRRRREHQVEGVSPKGRHQAGRGAREGREEDATLAEPHRYTGAERAQRSLGAMLVCGLRPTARQHLHGIQDPLV